MPRNPSGDYTLPLAPVIPGATIESVWANTTADDLGTALGDSLSRSGQGSMSATLRLIDGTVTNPGIAFTNEGNTGFYRDAPGDLYVSVLGQAYMRWTDDNGVQVSTDGTTWFTVAHSDDVADLQTQITTNADNITANEVELTDHESRITAIETADPFVANSLQIGGEVNQLSEAISGTSGNLTADTTVANRFILTNNGTINLTISLPVAVRDIGPNYTIEGNIIVTNGAAPGVISIAGALAGEVLGNNSVTASAQSLLSYVIHNRGGVYTKIYIWTAVT